MLSNLWSLSVIDKDGEDVRKLREQRLGDRGIKRVNKCIAISSCHKLSEAVRSCQKLSEAVRSCLKLSEAVIRCHKLSYVVIHTHTFVLHIGYFG